jgi:hypothetical protein
MLDQAADDQSHAAVRDDVDVRRVGAFVRLRQADGPEAAEGGAEGAVNEEEDAWCSVCGQVQGTDAVAALPRFRVGTGDIDKPTFDIPLQPFHYLTYDDVRRKLEHRGFGRAEQQMAASYCEAGAVLGRDSAQLSMAMKVTPCSVLMTTLSQCRSW